jgi:hypothetical protein
MIATKSPSIGSLVISPLTTPTNRAVVGADLREAGDVHEPSHVTLRTGGDADPSGPTKEIRAPLPHYRPIHSQVSVHLTNGWCENVAYKVSGLECLSVSALR